MRKNNVHRRFKPGSTFRPTKPTLLALSIAQALAFQAAQAASIEVTSNLDDGTNCTIREAIDTINAGVEQNNDCIINGALGTADEISLGSGVAGSTIVTNAELMITKSVSINSGGVNTTIDANGVGRVIYVDGSRCTSFPCSNVDTQVELDQLTLTGGNATGYGGGISNNFSVVTLSNSTVSGNTSNRGGGIHAFESHFTLTNSTVSGNSAELAGGGIAATFGFIRLTNSTVSGNTTAFGGGIHAWVSSPVILSNSTVSGNTAVTDGGGIVSFYNAADITLTNSTVSGNSAGRDGGGIFAYSDGLTHVPVNLNNSTITDNSAGRDGGGIFSEGWYQGSLIYDSYVTLNNSIVANSIGADCTIRKGTVTAMTDSLIEDGSCGTTAMAVDPLLGPLADKGGPTLTHDLLAGSPAIDNGTGPGATATDQRGVAAEGIRDSGAYEFTGAINTLTLEKLINHRVRETPGTTAQLLAGTHYRADYKVTNNSPNRVYSVKVFEGGQLVCNLYDLMPGQSKQPASCTSNQDVLVGSNNVAATVTAKVSGSNQDLADQTNAYYTGYNNMRGKLTVTHYVNDRNADTQANAVVVNSNQADVTFRIENTGSIELYSVKTYHDPVSPVNSGWQEQCFIGTLDPGQIRYCKRTINATDAGLNKAFGRVQGRNTNVGAAGVVNASNPTYFNVVLP